MSHLFFTQHSLLLHTFFLLALFGQSESPFTPSCSSTTGHFSFFYDLDILHLISMFLFFFLAYLHLKLPLSDLFMLNAPEWLGKTFLWLGGPILERCYQNQWRDASSVTMWSRPHIYMVNSHGLLGKLGLMFLLWKNFLSWNRDLVDNFLISFVLGYGAVLVLDIIISTIHQQL